MNQTLTIKIERKSKFGVQTNGVWFNISKRAQKEGLTPDSFNVDGTYTVEVSTNEYQGKTYRNIERILPADAPVSVDAPALPKTYAPASQTKVRDFDAEARGKTRCALFEAALQSPGIATYSQSYEEFMERVEAAAEMGMKFVFPND